MHHFPSNMAAALKAKKRILKVEQKKIARMLTSHSEQTKEMIITFGKHFKTFRKVTLPTKKEFLASMNNDNRSYIY